MKVYISVISLLLNFKSTVVVYTEKTFLNCISCVQILIDLKYFNLYSLQTHHTQFFAPCFVNSRDCSLWNTQTSPSGTKIHGTIKVRDHSTFSFWCLMTLPKALDPYLHYFLLCVAATWLADLLTAFICRCIYCHEKMFLIKWF